jgi:hypothetical protein
MPDDTPPDFGPIITVRYDLDEARIVYDLGDIDPWAASAILRQVARRVTEDLPTPREASEMIEDEEED